MRKIKNKDTGPELFVRKVLHKRGFRFTLSNNKLPGKPDVVLPKYRTALFVHGCYWHRHDCRKGSSIPSTNREKWVQKFANNVARDQKALRELEALGYRMLVVWECELRKDAESVMDKVERVLRARIAGGG